MAQEHFETHTKKDGLTSPEVTVTLVDSRGVVWIGTSNGLTAYSGKKWYAIKSIKDSESGRNRAFGSIGALFEDSKKNIWVGSSKGLFLFDGKHWTSFKKDDDDNFIPVFFMEDRQGRLWLEYEYVQAIDASVQMNFKLTNGMLHMYKDGRWLNFDDIIGGTVAVNPGNPMAYFSSLFQDRMGNVWVGTQEGAFRFNGQAWEVFKEKELKSEKVRSILEDRQGRIWVAMDNGIACQKEDGWLIYHKKDGLSGSNISQLKEDNRGRIWAFVHSNPKFVALAVFENDKWHSYKKNNIKLKSAVSSLIMNGDEVIAFAKDGLSVFKNNDWQKYGKKEGLVDEVFSMIKRDRYGIWLAGETAFYQLNKDHWEKLFQVSDKWNVSVIFVENRERIWLGTERDGIYLLSAGKWKHYSDDSALADNHILDVFKDKSGAVWVVSRTGVTRVSRDSQ
jgi:ligand-binding sensor domain-containing protein